MKLIHVTSAKNWESILSDGHMNSMSYWTSNDDIAAYYAEGIEEEGENPVYLEINVEDLDGPSIEPDHPSISEPIMTVLREFHGWERHADEEYVWEEWEGSDQSWQASLDLVGSIRYLSPIPSTSITITNELTPHLRSFS